MPTCHQALERSRVLRNYHEKSLGGIAFPFTPKNEMKDAANSLLTVAEVADYLRVSIPTIRRWISLGHLPHVKLSPGRRNGCVRIRRSDLHTLVDRRSASGADR